jgi:membrane-associated protein
MARTPHVVAVSLQEYAQHGPATLLTVPEHLALLSAISPQHLLGTFGELGVMVILFLELGVLVCFFLPGDSLLFVAGYATVENNSLHLHLSLPTLLVAAFVGAAVGGQVGFYVGRRTGEELHARHSRYYKQEYVDRSRRLLSRFGLAKAVLVSRFVPVVRTFVGPIVGVAGMSRTAYTTANLVASVSWVVPIILLGHWLGHVTFIRKYVELLAVAVVIVSVVPALWHFSRARRRVV